MKRIELRTRQGVFLAVVEIPHFDPMPEIIAWDRRVFTRLAEDAYREADIITCTTPAPGFPRDEPPTVPQRKSSSTLRAVVPPKADGS